MIKYQSDELLFGITLPLFNKIIRKEVSKSSSSFEHMNYEMQ